MSSMTAIKLLTPLWLLEIVNDSALSFAWKRFLNGAIIVLYAAAYFTGLIRLAIYMGSDA